MSLTAEQLALRRTGITGTDLPAILGLSAFSTPLEVFLEKKGLLPPKEQTEDMERGDFLEDGARRWYAHRTGALRVDQPGTVVSRRNPLVIATPDGVAHFTGDVRALEIKMPSSPAGWGAPGTDAIPEWYLPQVAWELAALDLPHADVFAVLDGKPRLYHVARDLELEGLLVEHAERFWRDHVVADKPPEATAKDADAVKRWLPRSETADYLCFDALSLKARAEIEHYLHTHREAGDVAERLKHWETVAKMHVGTAPGVIGLPEDTGFHRLDWKSNRDGAETDWRKVAESVRDGTPFDEAVRQHTQQVPGKRPFVPRPLKRGAR